MERIYFTWDKWECYPAGFYDDTIKSDKTKDQLEQSYADFLANSDLFRKASKRVIVEWPNSCEHYLTNERMNRIAWLGQASACIAMGLPSKYRSGYFLLKPEEQKRADILALRYLNGWLFDSFRFYGEYFLFLDMLL